VPIVRALSKPTGVAAEFEDLSLSVGKITLPDGRVRYAVFNWGDTISERQLQIPSLQGARDVWTGERIASSNGVAGVRVAPHSSVLVEIVAAPSVAPDAR